MKTKLLFMLVTLLTSTINYAQCSRSGTFVQSDPLYSISGDAKIDFTTSGNKDVVFEMNFETVQGADLRVYLSKTDDIATAGSDAVQISSQLINDDGGTGGPGTSPITGMKTFAMPASSEIDTYDFIVIQCITINERWGHVSLGANSGADCNILNVEENILKTQVNFAPNPAKETITISNSNNLDLSFTIVDLLGKIVISKESTTLSNQEINLQSLKTGVYLLQLNSNGKTVTKKLIKQ